MFKLLLCLSGSKKGYYIFKYGHLDMNMKHRMHQPTCDLKIPWLTHRLWYPGTTPVPNSPMYFLKMPTNTGELVDPMV